MYQHSVALLSTAWALAPLAYATPRVLNLDFSIAKNEAPAAAVAARTVDKTSEVQLSNLKALYLLNISVGTPPQQLQVQIDTGSADLWMPESGKTLCNIEGQSCGQTGSYDLSKSSTGKEKNSTNPFLIAYGDDSKYMGKYVTDKVTIGSTSLTNVQFGLVDEATNVVSIPGVPKSNGIMGVGFSTIEAGVKFLNDTPYPNFVQELKRQNIIWTAYHTRPVFVADAATGSILFGGVDNAKYDGPLINLPIVDSYGEKGTDRMYVELTSLATKDNSGSKDLVSSTVYPALLDSGAGGIQAPGFLVKALMDYTGAVFDATLGGPAAVPCNLSTAEASIVFGFGGKGGPQISVPLADLIDDTPAPIFFNDGTSACLLGIRESPDNTLTLGDPFLRSAYAVFNLEKKTIALAQAKPNPQGSNIQAIKDGQVSAVSTALPSLTVAAASTAAPLTAAGTSPPDSPTLVENPGRASVTAERAAGPSGSGPSSGVAKISIGELGYLPVLITGVVASMAAFGGLFGSLITNVLD